MFKRFNNTFLVDLTCISILLVVLVYVLYIGASLIIPLLIALLFSFAIIGLSNFYKKIKIPSILAFIFSVGTYILIIWLIGKMIGSNIEELRKLLPIYQSRLFEIYHYIFAYLGIQEPESITEILQTINFQAVFSSIIGAFTSIFSRMGLIIFFIIFILLENRFFHKKLYLMIKDSPKSGDILETIDKIKSDVKSYFVVKTFVSFITALLCYIIMSMYGLDFAIFWALLVFILNFIPNIGSIIAVFLPGMLSLVQPLFTFYDSLIMISLLTGVQVLMGNIIEPQFMGNKLNLSPLVIIISLAFWGMMWGVVGMLLSVPLMVIINIILAKMPSTRPIAVLLSEKGDLRVESSEELIKNRKKMLKAFKEKLEKIDVRKKK